MRTSLERTPSASQYAVSVPRARGGDGRRELRLAADAAGDAGRGEGPARDLAHLRVLVAARPSACTSKWMRQPTGASSSLRCPGSRGRCTRRSTPSRRARTAGLVLVGIWPLGLPPPPPPPPPPSPGSASADGAAARAARRRPGVGAGTGITMTGGGGGASGWPPPTSIGSGRAGSSSVMVWHATPSAPTTRASRIRRIGAPSSSARKYVRRSHGRPPAVNAFLPARMPHHDLRRPRRRRPGPPRRPRTSARAARIGRAPLRGPAGSRASRHPLGRELVLDQLRDDAPSGDEVRHRDVRDLHEPPAQAVRQRRQPVDDHHRRAEQRGLDGGGAGGDDGGRPPRTSAAWVRPCDEGDARRRGRRAARRIDGRRDRGQELQVGPPPRERAARRPPAGAGCGRSPCAGCPGSRATTGPRGIEAVARAGTPSRSRVRRHEVDQRMADERDRARPPRVELLLEREDDEHARDVLADRAQPPRPPGPDLRRDVVDDGNAAACSARARRRLKSG